jgi:hypothetical protein
VTTLKTNGEVRSMSGPAQLEFATVYRENFGRLAAFFARRCRDPQQVRVMAPLGTSVMA